MALPPKFSNPKTSNPKFPPPRRSNPPLPPAFPPLGGLINDITGPAAAVPLVALSRPGDSWVWDFDNLAMYNKAVKKVDRKIVAGTWLSSERYWRNRVGKGWVAKSVLGRGSYGVVGHWSYEGPDRDKKALKDVAVKQSQRTSMMLGGWGLESETACLLELGKAKSQHCLRMYRHLYEEMGQRTNSYDTGLVHRIFLEYCPGGDMGQWVRSHLQNNTSVGEAEMWAIFHCLARACLVVDHGSENANFPTPGWPRQEIVHFDLKLENVLIGEPTTDMEHRDAPPFKFGDFGMAKRVLDDQSARYLKDHSEWGTPEYYAPEQMLVRNHYGGSRPWFDLIGLHNVVEPRYGSATNIWQVGLIMHCLLSRSSVPNWASSSINRLRCYKSILSARLESSGNTIGNSTDQACEYKASMSVYSIELRTMIHECLIVNPKGRPRPSTVVQKTGESIDELRMSMGGFLNASFKNYEEPTFSARWYSGQNNGDPATRPRKATPKQITAADKLHAANIAIEKAKIAQGIRPPPPPRSSGDGFTTAGPVSPIRQVRKPPPTPAPIPAPIPRPAPTPALIPKPIPAPAAPQAPAVEPPLPGTFLRTPIPIPAPARVLHNVTQVTCIVQTKSFFGGPVFKNYTLKNLTPETAVIVCKNKLAELGCGIASEGMRWMNGRTLMTDSMKLGEFENLVGGRNSIRVTQI